VSGSGFATNTTVHVFFDRNGGKQIGAELTDGSGNLPAFNVTIPSVIAGSYPIIATDGTNVATTTFTVPSSLTLNPSSGGSGTSVSVMGAGYLAGEGIVVSWDHPGQGNQVAAPTADSSGSFTTSFSVPSSSGTHTVFATGRSSHFALSAAFAVSGNVGGANLTISPTSGAAGTAVSVNGTGFGASEQVTLALDGTNAFSVTSDGSGNFGTSLTLPSTLALGAHTISAAGVSSGHTAFVTFSVTSTSQQSTSCGGDEDSRPGEGHGDDNHCHTGSPGHEHEDNGNGGHGHEHGHGAGDDQGEDD
jgi:hypothetical protein